MYKYLINVYMYYNDLLWSADFSFCTVDGHGYYKLDSRFSFLSCIYFPCVYNMQGRLYLSAETAKEMNEWISQIRSAMSALRNGPKAQPPKSSSKSADASTCSTAEVSLSLLPLFLQCTVERIAESHPSRDDEPIRIGNEWGNDKQTVSSLPAMQSSGPMCGTDARKDFYSPAL